MADAPRPKTTTDPGPSPGPQFVKVKWLKQVGDEAVGSIEWAEQRRAAGLVRDGFAELVIDPA